MARTTRQQRRQKKAVNAKREGIVTYWQAQIEFLIPKSTVFNHIKKLGDEKSRSKRFALMEKEQSVIVQLIFRFADRGIPIKGVIY